MYKASANLAFAAFLCFSPAIAAAQQDETHASPLARQLAGRCFRYNTGSQVRFNGDGTYETMPVGATVATRGKWWTDDERTVHFVRDQSLMKERMPANIDRPAAITVVGDLMSEVTLRDGKHYTARSC